MANTMFTPMKVGRLDLAQRIALAPMTRSRVDDDHVPLPFVTEYYSQRSSVPGTLLISEATLITPQAGTYPNVPGIYSAEQIAAWKKVTDAVHEKGCYIYMQLWALGRTGDAKLLKAEGNYDLVSSSAKALDSEHSTPRALTEVEIEQYIRDYAQAARNAVQLAGFNGVELHGASGYLIDQFTQDTVNQRTDRWGGSIENRARFAIEATKAVADAIGADRTAIRFSPYSDFQGMCMEESQLIAQFTYLAQELAKMKLSYVHLVEPRVNGPFDVEHHGTLHFFLDAYDDASPVLIAGGYTSGELARKAVESDYKTHRVVIVFGRMFLSNPDLPFRLREGIDLTPYDRSTFFLPKMTKGYIDYPFSEEFKQALAKRKA